MQRARFPTHYAGVSAVASVSSIGVPASEAAFFCAALSRSLRMALYPFGGALRVAWPPAGIDFSEREPSGGLATAPFAAG